MTAVDGCPTCANRTLPSTKMAFVAPFSPFSAIPIPPLASASWSIPAVAWNGSCPLPRPRCATSSIRSGRAYLLQDFTSDPAALDHAITILHAYGQTALFDAIVQGLVKVEQGRWPKRALLVMTDGMDNASTYTLPDVIAAARRAGVLIYTVGLGVSNISNASNTPFFGGFGFGFGRRLLAAQQVEVDASTLRTLSEDTGGTTFVLNPRVTNLSELDAHFQAISAELREQYTVLFSSSGGSGPQPIKVEATRPGLDVRAPKWADAGAYSASR